MCGPSIRQQIEIEQIIYKYPRNLTFVEICLIVFESIEDKQ